MRVLLRKSSCVKNSLAKNLVPFQCYSNVMCGSFVGHLCHLCRTLLFALLLLLFALCHSFLHGFCMFALFACFQLAIVFACFLLVVALSWLCLTLAIVLLFCGLCFASFCFLFCSCRCSFLMLFFCFYFSLLLVYHHPHDIRYPHDDDGDEDGVFLPRSFQVPSPLPWAPPLPAPPLPAAVSPAPRSPPWRRCC